MAFNETPTKGFVMKLLLPSDINKLSTEEIAAYNRKMTRKAIRNILIFVGVKAAIYYGIHRLSKYAAENQ